MTFTRLTAEEFINEVKAAPAWDIWINPMIGELELVVPDMSTDPPTKKKLYGPDPMTAKYEPYKKFLLDLEELTTVTEIAQLRVPIEE